MYGKKEKNYSFQIYFNSWARRAGHEFKDQAWNVNLMEITLRNSICIPNVLSQQNNDFLTCLDYFGV